jgi:GDPmannose 4,6-dehydratase
MNKKALICGVSGQDGAYLANFLLKKGYKVWGTSRDAQGNSFTNLRKLGISDSVRCVSMVPEDFRSVFITLRNVKPDEVYYLAGQSSVGLSFDLPAETMQSMVIGTLNFLEAIRTLDYPIRFYNAGSSESFGDVGELAATEHTPFHPQSPYAVSKSSAFWLVNNYRDAYNLNACTGILFNHESPLRSSRFVTKKIIESAKKIANGEIKSLQLGNLKISRDWGWAPEYVEAMWLMLQQDRQEDYIIATGKTNTLENFVDITFNYFSLDWQEYVVQNETLFRPSDITISKASPLKAEKVLGWKAKVELNTIIEKMINDIYF